MLRFFKTNPIQKVVAILVILAVVGVGAYLISAHASPPSQEAVATSGSVTGNAVKTSESGTNYVNFDNSSATPPPAGSCATNPPTSSGSSLYTLVPGTASQPNPVIFNKTVPAGASIQSVYPQFGSYGNMAPSGYGYYLTSHWDFTGQYLAVKGYPDTAAGSYKGVVGAGFDINNPEVQAGGGVDVCMKLSNGPWANNGNSTSQNGVNMVLISWPVDGWQDGENDFFEGNAQTPDIHLHLNDCNTDYNLTNPSSDPKWCGHAVQYQWPTSSTGDGNPHLYSARWNSSTGYSYFFDDLTLASSGLIANNSTYTPAPTTPHQISLQMQDSSCTTKGPTDGASECNTVDVEADIYWVAIYSYNG